MFDVGVNNMGRHHSVMNSNSIAQPLFCFALFITKKLVMSTAIALSTATTRQRYNTTVRREGWRAGRAGGTY